MQGMIQNGQEINIAPCMSTAVPQTSKLQYEMMHEVSDNIFSKFEDIVGAKILCRMFIQQRRQGRPRNQLVNS